MKILTSLTLTIIFITLAAIHVYWGFGGKKGATATIPTKANGQPVMNPGLFDCLVVAVGLLAFGVFVLVRSGMIACTLPAWLLNYGLWMIGALFLLRAIGEFKYVGFFKKVKTTTFGQMDTRFYSPLCLLIGALTLVLQLLS